MAVDEVNVLRFVLPQPMEGTGYGLFAWGDAEVEFSETTITGTTPRIFVIMPFKEPFDTLYREVIQPVAAGVGFDVVRVDEVFGPGIILNDIQQQIEERRCCRRGGFRTQSECFLRTRVCANTSRNQQYC